MASLTEYRVKAIKDEYDARGSASHITFAIALCMHCSSCKDLSQFKSWLSSNDWHKLIHDIEEKYLNPFTPAKIRTSAKREVKEEIAAEKDAWRAERAQRAHQDGEREKQPNWKKKQQERLEAEI